MHKIGVILSTLLLLVSSLASAESPTSLFSPEVRQTAIELRETAMAGSPAYSIVESLTTEVGPRLAGSPNDIRAVEWMEATFESLGFDKVWREPVQIPVWQRLHESADVIIPYPQPLEITALGGSVSTPEGGLTAEIVHFGDLEELTRSTTDLAGKIAFISNRMAASRDGSGYGTAWLARRNGAVEAARKGASAVLIRSIGTDSHRFPHTGLMRYQDDVPLIPAAALSNPDADQLVRILARESNVTLSVNIQTKSDDNAISYNVIADLIGREAPEEIILISAHLDSWDLGTGAIDDGAGIGITSAAAHLISKLPTRPRRTIRVVAFAAEETGLYGAKAYAERHEYELENHIIGSESDFGGNPIFMMVPGVHENALPAIAAIQALLEPIGVSELGPNTGSGGPDMTYLKIAGMPVTSLVQDGYDYFDYHHTADDTLDKLTPEWLDQCTAVYAVFAYLAANWSGRFK